MEQTQATELVLAETVEDEDLARLDAELDALVLRTQRRIAGALGGRATREKYGIDHFQRIGSRGGQTTWAKYGLEHYRELGHRGLRALARKYFKGNVAAALDWLQRAGWAATDPCPWNGAFPIPPPLIEGGDQDELS